MMPKRNFTFFLSHRYRDWTPHEEDKIERQIRQAEAEEDLRKETEAAVSDAATSDHIN